MKFLHLQAHLTLVVPHHSLRSRPSPNLLNENPSISEMLLGTTDLVSVLRWFCQQHAFFTFFSCPLSAKAKNMASAQTVTPVFPSSCAFIYLLLYLLIQPFIDSSIHPFTHSSTHPFFSSSVHTFIFSIYHLLFIQSSVLLCIYSTFHVSFIHSSVLPFIF